MLALFDLLLLSGRSTTLFKSKMIGARGASFVEYYDIYQLSLLRSLGHDHCFGRFARDGSSIGGMNDPSKASASKTSSVDSLFERNLRFANVAANVFASTQSSSFPRQKKPVVCAYG